MVILLLRHADREPVPADTLSPEGIERAKRLALMLAHSGVSRGFCSDAQRTRETLAPLKAALGTRFSVTEVPTSAGIATHVQTIVDAIKALPADAVSVVVGHSNTIGPIIDGLGGGTIAPIGETEFDKLFIVCRPATGDVTRIELRY